MNKGVRRLHEVMSKWSKTEIQIEMRRFRVFAIPEEPGVVGRWSRLGGKKREKRGSDGSGWEYNLC
jgi:hypothetical protein